MSFGVVALSTGKTEKYYANVYMPSVLAAASLGASSVAYAATPPARSRALIPSKDLITLDNGSSYLAPKA